MFTDSFDARSVQPSQGFDVHPPGMFDATISNTYAKPTASGTGGRFVVEYTTPAGRIENGYNIWNESPKAVEIAQKELSALCHATGIYKISFPKDQSGNPILDLNCAVEGLRLKLRHKHKRMVLHILMVIWKSRKSMMQAEMNRASLV